MNTKNILLNWRFLLISSAVICALIAIVFKVLSIQFIDSSFLKDEGNKRYIKYKDINPVRGTIFDRNNFPLAVSIVNYDLYALSGFKKSQLLSVAEVIDIDVDINKDIFIKKTILKKGLSNNEILSIKKLNLRNFEIEVRHSRHYPLGEQIATLIGFYGTDGAQEGLEKSYDNVLSGINGKQKFFKNAKQEIISQPLEVIKTVQGEDIHLTIDATLQFYSYKYLAEAIKKNKAKSGTVIILDNKKGELLAMASYPSYNPNNPQRKIQKNRALVEAYELGSVLKPIVLSKAFDNELFLPDEIVDIPRRLNLNDKVIIDSKNHIELTPKEIIAVSSQVGASKIALELGYKDLKKNYYDFGFTKPISINFPSSSFGYMNVKEKVLDKELASLGYGYGIKVSPFQIASAYSVFANNGVIKDFQIFKNQKATSQKIISSESASHILDALRMVVEDGTGKTAKIKGFSVGGKTGTAHQTRTGSGYAEDLYIASFVGIAPISDQSLTIFVSIENPGLNSYTGGAVAAPVFAKIAESSLNHLGYFQDE
ncbi:MAG: penicillin-binding protein 2 [SAR86 cluster bacterium]|uniref:Penicillin-binding protein 2 n=1 Tax=SAR86 cluster bacterium TaxID=2030880 RepID=A0A520N5T1_9GAMM|nr:MAG: penicillin-binding protein 2 [SAR86 cluster bacterium]|tara:strand:+ start:2899 stop:4518 length:1620 start_codon:yes stop_codon:yes gene_type:complete